MADNVIRLQRSANDNDDAEWTYEVQLHCDAMGNLRYATLPAVDSAAALRGMADNVEQVAWWLRHEAEKLDPDPEQDIAVAVNINGSGEVFVLARGEVFMTLERMTWLKDRFTEAFRKIVDC